MEFIKTITEFRDNHNMNKYKIRRQQRISMKKSDPIVISFPKVSE